MEIKLFSLWTSNFLQNVWSLVDLRSGITHCILTEPDNVPLIACIEEDRSASGPVLVSKQVSLLEHICLCETEVINLQT